MAIAVVCMFACAVGCAGLAGRDGGHAVYDAFAALFLIGAFSLLGIAIGLELPL